MTGRPRHVLIAALALGAWFSAAPGRAGVIAVDWDVVPHDHRQVHHGDSPYYDCEGSHYSERLCRSLWEDGLVLETRDASFYDDKWFEGPYQGVRESLISGRFSEGRIRASCKPGLGACFDGFKPVSLTLHAFTEHSGWPSMFLLSSRGGVMTIPAMSGETTIDFSGRQWKRLEWLEFGFYTPEVCFGDDAPDHLCLAQPRAVVPGRLIAAVPEPAIGALLGVGLVGWVARRRWCPRG